MNKKLFLLLSAMASFLSLHAEDNTQIDTQNTSTVEQTTRKQFMPVKPAPEIPTITAGWLDITKEIGDFEEILTPLSKLVEDSSIDIIIIRINSTGGSPGDAHIIADYINAAKSQKPIIAFISRMGTSAAYRIAAACSYIICPASAEVGSIGTVAYFVFDKDKQYYIITSGLFKAPVVNQHHELDPKFIEKEQEMTKELTKIFAQGVSIHRNIPVETILSWQGVVFPGTIALQHGLVDKLGSMQDLFEKAVQLVSERNKDTEYQQFKLVTSDNKVLKTYQI